MLETHGFYKGYEYAIFMDEISCTRCGYVAIPKDHPYYGLSEKEIMIDVHGDALFSDICKLKGIDNEQHWIGYDCNHLYDAVDLEAVRTYLGEEEYKYALSRQQNDPIRRFCMTNANCIEECENIIEQLIKSSCK